MTRQRTRDREALLGPFLLELELLHMAHVADEAGQMLATCQRQLSDAFHVQKFPHTPQFQNVLRMDFKVLVACALRRQIPCIPCGVHAWRKFAAMN